MPSWAYITLAILVLLVILFFTASLGVKDVIKEIIEAEDRGRPFSDQAIVEKLRQDHGIILARRTVAKYREELQILPARLRKHS